jgi:hypothetical protein
LSSSTTATHFAADDRPASERALGFGVKDFTCVLQNGRKCTHKPFPLSAAVPFRNVGFCLGQHEDEIA